MISINQYNEESENDFSSNLNELDIDDPNNYVYENDDILDSDEVYDDILASELQDKQDYYATLKSIERGTSSSSHIPQINFIYEVKLDNGNVKEITDSFLIFKNNKEYLKTTFVRLRQVASNLGLTLTREDLKSITSIISACSLLIGRQAKIQQYSKGYFKRYQVFKAD